jgi:small subunit ribosomal protein S16
MPLRIRLMRTGKRKQPAYRVVVADSRSPRDGRFVEEVGVYNPLPNPSEIQIDEEKALGWLAKGAQPSASVVALLRATGVWQKFKQAKGKSAAS